MKPTTSVSLRSLAQSPLNLHKAAVYFLLALCSLACLPAALAQTAPTRDSSAPDAVARFKSFTEKPPVIEQIVFRVKRNFHLPIEANQGIETYIARYQDNAYFVQQIDSLDDFPFGPNKPTAYNPALSYLGRYENYYWHAAGDNFHETTDAGTNKDGKTNPVRKTSIGLCDSTLGSVLNFGIGNVNIGSLKWHDNTFEKIADTERPVLVKGTLSVAQGAPSQLKLSYGQYHWLIVYDYSIPMKPGFLPSGWTAYTIDEQGKPIPSSEVQIISCRIGRKQNKDRNAFLPKNVPYLEQIKCKSVYTNGEEFLVTSNGLVKPLVGLPLPFFSQPKP
jgi:hypothetical protein